MVSDMEWFECMGNCSLLSVCCSVLLDMCWDARLPLPANIRTNALPIGQGDGPIPLKSTGRHGHFLNSTCDTRLSDMRQGLKIIVTWDI